MNKASGGDGIPVELFQIIKDDAVKVLWGGRWEGGSCLGTHVRIKDFKIKKKIKN